MKQNCKQCGKTFEISESEIAFFKSKNLNIPKRCKECREKNKKDNSTKEIDAKKVYSIVEKTISNDNKTKRLVFIGIAVAIIAVVICAVFMFISGKNSDSNNEEIIGIEESNSDFVLDSNETVEPYVEPDLVQESELIVAESDAIEAVLESSEEPTPEIEPEPSEKSILEVTPEPSEKSIPEVTPEPSVEPTPKVEPEPSVEPEVATYTFRNAKLLNQHYEKHGIEMGFASAADYEKAAAAVINNPNALHKIEAEDGDYVFYVEATNEFVIVSTDGYIRTYFNPSGGKSYYERQ